MNLKKFVIAASVVSALAVTGCGATNYPDNRNLSTNAGYVGTARNDAYGRGYGYNTGYNGNTGYNRGLSTSAYNYNGRNDYAGIGDVNRANTYSNTYDADAYRSGAYSYDRTGNLGTDSARYDNDGGIGTSYRTGYAGDARLSGANRTYSRNYNYAARGYDGLGDNDYTTGDRLTGRADYYGNDFANTMTAGADDVRQSANAYGNRADNGRTGYGNLSTSAYGLRNTTGTANTGNIRNTTGTNATNDRDTTVNTNGLRNQTTTNNLRNASTSANRVDYLGNPSGTARTTVSSPAANRTEVTRNSANSQNNSLQNRASVTQTQSTRLGVRNGAANDTTRTNTTIGTTDKTNISNGLANGLSTGNTVSSPAASARVNNTAARTNTVYNGIAR